MEEDRSPKLGNKDNWLCLLDRNPGAVSTLPALGSTWAGIAKLPPSSVWWYFSFPFCPTFSSPLLVLVSSYWPIILQSLTQKVSLMRAHILHNVPKVKNQDQNHWEGLGFFCLFVCLFVIVLMYNSGLSQLLKWVSEAWGGPGSRPTPPPRLSHVL